MLDTVIQQRRRDLGGFEVGRLLPQAARRMVGPVIFFDHMGPVEFVAGIPSSVDVRPHPHIGLATVTYLFEGEILHRDSVGSEQPIRPGEVNWMIAGRGITHSERLERARREGGPMHGVQAWVALPNEHEERQPAFSHHRKDDLPLLEDAGARGWLIAGSAHGVASKVETLSPMFYLHWDMAAGSLVEVPGAYSERAVYVALGSIETEGKVIEAGQLAIWAPGGSTVLRALRPSVVMVLGGEPVGPRFIDWNFVSSSKARIEQAKADWQAGRMKLPDLDGDEFIPLPWRSPCHRRPFHGS